MRFLPYYSETLVLPYNADEIIKKLSHSVLIENAELLPEERAKNYHFVGRVEKNYFKIFRKITQPNNYLPLIFGSIEKTSSGSIIFLEYKLFQSTKYFLLFWSLISLGMGIFLMFNQKLYFYAALSFLLGIINYYITVVNFSRNTNRDKKLLQEILTQNSGLYS